MMIAKRDLDAGQVVGRDDVREITSLDRAAAFIDERINGGKFYEPQWYTEEQRELWRSHAAAIMHWLAADAAKEE